MSSLTAFRNFLQGIRLSRRECRLRDRAREALVLRDRVTRRDAGAEEALADWLVTSPEHVQVWLELRAVDEEFARRLGWPRLSCIMTPVASLGSRTSSKTARSSGPDR